MFPDKSRYIPSDHKVECDICGFEYLRSECIKTWDDLILCKKMCADGPRHPQDYLVRPKSDRQRARDAKPEEILTPTITTNSVTIIGGSTATCGGKVRNNGGASVTAQGVCWSTSHGPDVDDDVTDEGSGTNFSCDNTSYATKVLCQAAMHEWRENFETHITGLSATTTYYVKAYATNTEGTGYGPEVEFITTSTDHIVDPDGEHLVDPDGEHIIDRV